MSIVETAETPVAGTGTEHEGRDDRLHAGIFVGLAVLLAVAPMLGLYPILLMQILCFGIFACSFNLLLGYGGLMSFGHAAFFGLASYVSAYSAKTWGFPPELAILAGVVAAACLGAIFGWIAIRRQGIYFSMITLALGQMLYFTCVQLPYTGGEDGVQSVPRGRMFGFIDLADNLTLYTCVAVIFLATVALTFRIVHSPFGQVLKAIRDNELRAVSIGYRAARYKLMVFTLSAAIAGLAGGTKAIVFQLATLTDVHWTMSGEVILMTLVGGVGTMLGPLVGAAIIVAMQNVLAHFGAWIVITQGIVFVLCVVLFPKGIVGVLAQRLRRNL